MQSTTPHSRLELIQNAVAFLADPKTQGSPLAQKVQFLEAKGLNSAEIEDALRQAAATTQNGSAPAGPSYQQPFNSYYGPSPYASAVAPIAQQWDWRDYFITAVISGSVAYGAIALARKYLLPHLRPPTSTAYEEDRDALTAQFDAAEALLKEIQADTAAVKVAVEEQGAKVDRTVADVEDAVKEMREGEVKTRDEMREIREEVNNIRDMLPKMIEKNKESQNQSLAELQQELKSLKALLLSRGPSVGGAPASPLPKIPARPSIPAWQLGPSSSGLTPPPSSSSAPLFSLPPSSSSPLPNGKGKEVDVAPDAEGSS